MINEKKKKRVARERVAPGRAVKESEAFRKVKGLDGTGRGFLFDAIGVYWEMKFLFFGGLGFDFVDESFAE